MTLKTSPWPFVGFLVLLMFSSSCWARWYHVELIVFTYPDRNAADGEDWSVPEDIKNFSTAVTLAGQNSASDEIRQSSSFVPVGRASLKLAGIYNRLSADPKYKPVIHTAWRQPGYGANNVRQVYISDGRDRQNFDELAMPLDVLETPSAPSIEGTVGLQGGRLLHVGVNFAFRSSEAVTQIREFRKVKLKEIHYFDHPLFGVIIQITPHRNSASPAEPAATD